MTDNIKSPPIYKVLKQDTHVTGTYRRHETRLVVDGDPVFGTVGLKYENIDEPIFLKIDTVTQTKIDDKFYTVLIRESFEEIDLSDGADFAHTEEKDNKKGIINMNEENYTVDQEMYMEGLEELETAFEQIISFLHGSSPEDIERATDYLMEANCIFQKKIICSREKYDD